MGHVKRYGDAADAYLRTIEIDPERYVVYYRLGLCYEALEKQQEAAEYFKRFVELREEGADVEDAKRRLERILKEPVSHPPPRIPAFDAGVSSTLPLC